jgi:hypothetical protein
MKAEPYQPKNKALNGSPFESSGSGDPSLSQGDRMAMTAEEAADERQRLDDAGQLSEEVAEYLDRIIARG